MPTVHKNKTNLNKIVEDKNSKIKKYLGPKPNKVTHKVIKIDPMLSPIPVIR